MISERLDPDYLPDAVKQALVPILQRDIERMQAWDEDQRGLALEFAEARKHGVEKQKSDEEFAQFFAQSDATNDGMLQRDQYLVFAELYRVAKEKRGEPDTPKSEEDHVEFHNAVNLRNPETDGLS